MKEQDAKVAGPAQRPDKEGPEETVVRRRKRKEKSKARVPERERTGPYDDPHRRPA